MASESSRTNGYTSGLDTELGYRRENDYLHLFTEGTTHNIQCRKAILARNSPFFKALIEEKDPKQYTFRTIEHGILQKLVDYMYDGEIDVTIDNVFKVYKGADKLQIESLKCNCRRFLSNKLTCQNAVGLMMLGMIAESESITLVCFDYVVKHLEDVKRHFLYSDVKTIQEVLQFRKDCHWGNTTATLELVTSWLKSQNINAQNKHSWELIKQIPVSEIMAMDRDDLRKILEQNDFLHRRQETKDYLEGILKEMGGNTKRRIKQEYEEESSHSDGQTRPNKRVAYSGEESRFDQNQFHYSQNNVRSQKQSDHDGEAFIQTKRPHPAMAYSPPRNLHFNGRNSIGHRAHHGVRSSGPKVVLCQTISDNRIDLIQLDLETLQPETIGMTEDFSVIESFSHLNHKIYFLGKGARGAGNVSKPYETIVRVFDVNTRKWDQHASLMVNRGSYKTTVADDCLIAIGGYSGSRVTNSVDRLKLSLESRSSGQNWNSGVKIPAITGDGRLNFGVGTLDSKIYIAGGIATEKSRKVVVTNNLDCFDFDISTNQWEEKTQMMYRTQGAAVVTVNSELYVLGGIKSDSVDFNLDKMSSAVQIYDPRQNRWSEGRSMFRKRTFFSAVFHAPTQRLYAIGGDNKKYPTVEYFDLATQLWTRMGKLPFPNCSFECVAYIQ